jgi:hypothetical protein
MANNGFVILDSAWAQELERGVEDYADALSENVMEGDGEMITLSGEPYCGCSTCHYREVLFYVTPKIIQAYNEGKVNLEE